MSEHSQKSVTDRNAEAQKAMAQIPHKILVMSGKGGVGKTSVAVNLAYSFAAQGMSVGLMDADLHGPNVALMTGVEGVRVGGDEGHLMPVIAAGGVRVLSISGLLPDPDAPLIWRGPMKAGIIAQFLGEGDWTGTDVLIVDCPPGTGDEPLSVAQLIPDADGVVIVTQPQDVSLLDSRKSVNFVKKVGLPVLGIIENMAGFICPHCGEHIDLFGVGGGEKAAGELDVPFLGRVPITAQMVKAGDSGFPLVTTHPEDPAVVSLLAISEAIQKAWQHPEAEKSPAPLAGVTRIVVTAMDMKGMAATVSDRFGHSGAFVVVDIVDNEIVSHRSVKSPFADNHHTGQIPRFIRDLGATVILSAEMGSHAFDAFHAYGMDVITGVAGTVGEVIADYIVGNIGVHHDPAVCGTCNSCKV